MKPFKKRSFLSLLSAIMFLWVGNADVCRAVRPCNCRHDVDSQATTQETPSCHASSKSSQKPEDNQPCCGQCILGLSPSVCVGRRLIVIEPTGTQVPLDVARDTVSFSLSSIVSWRLRISERFHPPPGESSLFHNLSPPYLNV